MVPSSLGSRSSMISSSRYSKPTNIPTSPAGNVATDGLDILKSNISRELSFFLYTSTRALSILVLTPALNGLYAAGVGSLSASFRRLFDNLFLVTSLCFAIEDIIAVSQSQLPEVPLKPCKNL